MSIDDFKQFFATLKDNYANELLDMHISAYDVWGVRLPKAVRAKVPKRSVRVICFTILVYFDPDFLHRITSISRGHGRHGHAGRPKRCHSSESNKIS